MRTRLGTLYTSTAVQKVVPTHRATHRQVNKGLIHKRARRPPFFLIVFRAKGGMIPTRRVSGHRGMIQAFPEMHCRGHDKQIPRALDTGPRHQRPSSISLEISRRRCIIVVSTMEESSLVGRDDVGSRYLSSREGTIS